MPRVAYAKGQSQGRANVGECLILNHTSTSQPNKRGLTKEAANLIEQKRLEQLGAEKSRQSKYAALQKN